MARITGPFGVQGWVKLRTYTQDADALAGFPRWHVRTPEGWEERGLEGFDVRPNGCFAKLAGTDERDGAQALQGAEVAVLREELGEAGEGSYFWVDLVGLEVVDEGGAVLGRVESLFETGETSVMVVRGSTPGRERMIPFVQDYVKAVDRGSSRITVDWKPEYDA